MIEGQRLPIEMPEFCDFLASVYEFQSCLNYLATQDCSKVYGVSFILCNDGLYGWVGVYMPQYIAMQLSMIIYYRLLRTY